MLTIDVYTGPNCASCVATKAWLKREGLEFNEVDATADGIAEMLLENGFRELPVVVAGERRWSGFRYAQLVELKAMVYNA